MDFYRLTNVKFELNVLPSPTITWCSQINCREPDLSMMCLSDLQLVARHGNRQLSICPSGVPACVIGSRAVVSASGKIAFAGAAGTSPSSLLLLDSRRNSPCLTATFSYFFYC